MIDDQGIERELSDVELFSEDVQDQLSLTCQFELRTKMGKVIEVQQMDYSIIIFWCENGNWIIEDGEIEVMFGVKNLWMSTDKGRFFLNKNY